MATVTGLTAERMLEIEAASVVDGDVSGNDLILTRKDGSIINAGNVRGVPGPVGPMGEALEVVSGLVVGDVGMANQIRAGRQLTVADFTNMGLSVPLALWNLSNANDSSGNGRHLTIRGGVPFGLGINGLASTAAVFAGSTTQALWLPDGGINDPMRFRTGSWGAWVRSARRGGLERIVAKVTSPGGNSDFGWDLSINANVISANMYNGSALTPATGVTDLRDDRWHFLVATNDGTKLRVYVDANMEGWTTSGLILPTSFGPINVGSWGATDVIAPGNPHWGRIDETFITADVLSDEHIRNLYCASVPHALGAVPSSVSFSVRRKRRGQPLLVSDFPAQPLRLYNLVNGALTDEGSQNAPLTLGTGTILDVAGPDGIARGAKHFAGVTTGLRATDAGLGFTALQPRSHGIWFKSTASASGGTMYSWGSDERLQVSAANAYSSYNAPDMIAVTAVGSMEGLWHFGVVVEDPNATDGEKRKLYLDGRLVGVSTALNAVTVTNNPTGLAIGMNATTGGPWGGQLDGMFIYQDALTPEQVRKLYDSGSKFLNPNVRDPADNIESVELGRLLCSFGDVESCDSIDLVVAA